MITDNYMLILYLMYSILARQFNFYQITTIKQEELPQICNRLHTIWITYKTAPEIALRTDSIIPSYKIPVPKNQ